MTSRIHLLDPEQAQQIAAGEVVERPANIVKELLENSLDADASIITIHIEKAGKKLIRITDNGCGMDAQDAQCCFSRHATSKLTSVDQLMSLETFGFRGEALASIAAVSKTTLTTKDQNSDDPLGTRVIYEHGAYTSTEAVACTIGTTIEVADLFETLPVRKTFLKQDETEWNQIMATVTGLALTHHQRTFKLFKDGNLFLNAPAVTTVKDRLTQLWGHNLTAQLTPVEQSKNEPVNITGLISQPPFARYGKQNVIFFVNNRLVKNNDLAKAILKGYKQALPPGKYPAACLFITTDPQQVDVNIHPRKEEVRFTKPGVVARIIQEAITYSLEQGVSQRLQPLLRPFGDYVGQASSSRNHSDHPAPFGDYVGQASSSESHVGHASSSTNGTAPVAAAPPTNIPLQSSAGPVTSNPLPAMPFEPAINAAPSPAVMPPQAATPQPGIAEKPTPEIQHETTSTVAPLRIVGQFFDTYIVVEQEDELIIVDQHAAHERILYHQFAHKFEGKEGTQLLFPETITLSAAGVESIIAHQSFFADQGIGLHQAGPTQLAITSTPPKLQKESLSDLLRDAADFIATHEHLAEEQFSRQLNEHVHSHMACKAAVRAGDTLDHDTMLALVEQLMRTPNRFMCVHGRPTMWPISKAEIEKRFRRR